MEYDVYGIVEAQDYIIKKDYWYNTPFEISKRSTSCLLKSFTSERLLKFIMGDDYNYTICRMDDKECYETSSFLRNEIITTIKTDMEFRSSDILMYKNKDYPVIHKYNIEKGRHELYIKHVIDVLVDKDIENSVDKIIEGTNKLIDEYNLKIENSTKVKPKEPPTKVVFTEGEKPSLISRIINKLKNRRASNG